MRYRSLIYIALLVHGSLPLPGQQLHTHLDKPHYFAGELLFYSMTLEPTLADSLVMGRVELSNAQTVVTHHYMPMRYGRGHGHVRVPYDLPSGVYYLVLDLFAAPSNRRIEVAKIPVSIYNAADLAHMPDRGAPPSPANSVDESIRVSLEPTPSSTRQRVRCSIQSSQGKLGRLSIAVRDQSMYGAGHTLISVPVQPILDDLLDAIPFSGRRSYNEENAIWSPLLYCAYPSTVEFSAVNVHPDGTFDMQLPNFYGTQNIDFVDFISDHISLEMAPPQARTYPEHPLIINRQVREQSELWELRKKIYQLSSQVELDPEQEEIPTPTIQIPPDHVVDVPDFALQGTLLTLFKEILAPLKFRRIKGGKYRARMLYRLHEVNYFYNSRTTFLVNNHLTRDGDYIANIPLQDVLRVTIYSDLQRVQRQFGAIGKGGIVIIEMKDKTFSLPPEVAMPTQRLQGIQHSFRYPILPDDEPDVPALSTLRYWEPHATPDDSGRYEFAFMTSDDLTDFEIEVVAHDRSGQVRRRSHRFAIESLSKGN